MAASKRFVIFSILCLLVVCLVYAQGQIKLRVTTDGSRLKSKPDFSAETLSRLNLGTVMTIEAQEGDWYRVSVEIEGQTFTGYIHKWGVEEISEEDLAREAPVEMRVEPSQEDVVAQIEQVITRSRQQVAQQRDLEEAVESLGPVIAKAFRISDFSLRGKIATEIYYLIAVAQEQLGNPLETLESMRNMFEVNEQFAKEYTRFMAMNDTLLQLMEFAELEYKGLINEYSLEVRTQPSDAEIFVNGREEGRSPKIIKSESPQFELEIRKEGFAPITEMILLPEIAHAKQFTLERIGKNLGIESTPEGAKVFMNGKDTGMVTDCLLEYVSFGTHKLRVVKANYVAWEGEIVVEQNEELNQIVNVTLTAGKYDFVRGIAGGRGGQFSKPKDIAFDPQGNFFVIDDSKEKVRKFDNQGRAVPTWEVGGRGSPGLKTLTGIAVGGDGSVYITDSVRHSVYKYNREGRFSLRVGGEGSGPEEFRLPFAVAVNSRNEVFVADYGNHCVKKFSHILKPAGTLGKPEGTRGVLRGPVSLAFNQNDELFVLDSNGIHKFSADGQYDTAWGRIELKANRLESPKCVYVDPQGYIFAADSGNHRIIKFDANGKFMMQWGTYGSGPAQFNLPNALAMNSRGEIYVVDKDNNRIQQFKVPGE
ncbi:MAG: PEGA domain-containing protein [Candidatus Aminicenantaceae bacterium]